MFLIFDRKREKNKSEQSDKEYYEVHCICQNCDMDRQVKISKGEKVANLTSPECSIAANLEKRKKSNEAK